MSRFRTGSHEKRFGIYANLLRVLERCFFEEHFAIRLSLCVISFVSFFERRVFILRSRTQAIQFANGQTVDLKKSEMSRLILQNLV